MADAQGEHAVAPPRAPVQELAHGLEEILPPVEPHHAFIGIVAAQLRQYARLHQVLVAVHVPVRLFDQGVHVRLPLPPGDAHGDGAAQLAAPQQIPPALDPELHQAVHLVPVHVLRDEQEFVAAVAVGCDAGALQAPQAFRHQDDHPISHVVAEVVVGLLQAVEVQEDDAAAAQLPIAAGKHLRQLGAVIQARESVPFAALQQPLPGQHVGSHVAHEHHGRPAALPLQHPAQHRPPGVFPVLLQQGAAEGGAEAVPRAPIRQRLAPAFLHLLPVLRVDGCHQPAVLFLPGLRSALLPEALRGGQQGGADHSLQVQGEDQLVGLHGRGQEQVAEKAVFVL